MPLLNCDSNIARGEASFPGISDNGRKLLWWPWKVTATARRHPNQRISGDVSGSYAHSTFTLQNRQSTASPFGGAEVFWLASLVCLLFCCSAAAQQSESVAEQSGWELSIANGLLLFKREKSVQLNAQPEQVETTAEADNAAFDDTEYAISETLPEPQIIEESWFVPAVHSHFSSEVSGIIARSTVVQTFKNPTEEWLHGSYQFPLPEDAAVDSLKMRIGKREIIGEIQRKQEARKRFANAKRQGQRASLVEQQKPNMFTTNLANIGPGEEIEIEIQFQQQARFIEGEFRLRFPTTYIPRANLPGVAMSEEEQAFFDADMASVFHSQFSADITLNARNELAWIKSPHYNLTIQQGEQHQYTLHLEEAQRGDRDLELTWRYQQTAPQVLHYREATQEGEYGMLMLLPGDEQQAPKTARQVTFVIDTSSSMGGDSIRQAKDALKLAVQSLQKYDQFNIIEFNSDAWELWHSPRAAIPENKQLALEYLAHLQARGGTDIFSALQLAMARQPQKNGSKALQQLVFITDGAIGYETELLAEIEAQLEDTRLFTVGIGAAPNSYFMVEAANVGRGSYTHIGNTHQVKTRMSQLLNQLASPGLTDIDVDLGMDVEMYPKKIPDLYHGEPLVLSYLAPHSVSDIQVRGMQAGKVWQQSLQLAYLGDHPGMAKNWAEDKIRYLSRQKRLIPAAGSHDQQSIAERITRLALKHQLVSSYTSLIAVERIVSAPTDADHSAQKARASNHHLMASMPNTAAGSRQAFVLALLALCLAGLLSGFSWLRERQVGMNRKTMGEVYVSQ